MKERLSRNPSACVMRSIGTIENSKFVIQDEIFTLSPGEGCLIWGDGSTIEQPKIFTKKNMQDVLDSVPVEKHQVMAYHDELNGGLLVLKNKEKKGVGIDADTPFLDRTIIISYGNMYFTCIWGETHEELNFHRERFLEQRYSRFN